MNGTLAAVKILVNCSLPFTLAHGGQAIQIQRTMTALEEIGLTVEPLRWWDANQQGDFIHYFGRPSTELIKLAQQKGIRIVVAELLTAQGSRSRMQLRLQKIISGFVKLLAPRNFTAAFNWDSYRLADICIALTPWEKHLMEYLFAAAPAKTFVVPNGVEDIFFQAAKTARGPWLVCTATVTERKRVLELAEAAVAAQTPVWIIGRAYAENDPYAQRFLQLAKSHPQFIRYEGGISDRAKLAAIYRSARGFVLLSAMESLSLSALEAAACECPLLLSDLPWARGTFGTSVSYCPLTKIAGTAVALKQFYAAAPGLPLPPKPATWREVAEQLKGIFEKVLNPATVRR